MRSGRARTTLLILSDANVVILMCSVFARLRMSSFVFSSVNRTIKSNAQVQLMSERSSVSVGRCGESKTVLEVRSTRCSRSV